jgi:hypothetical protein
VKSITQRLDEILVDPQTRTDENPSGDWSSARSFLALVLLIFEALSIADSEFRDPGAHVTVILAFIAGAYAAKVLDLRMAIGHAASSIGRRFQPWIDRVRSDEEGDPAPEDESEDRGRHDRE